MKEYLPTLYVSILLVLLAGIAFFVFQQIIRVRRRESRFSRLQKKLQKEQGTAQEYYELGSLYLDKNLFVQAIQLFQKAIKKAEKEEVEPENIALIYNALGYSYYSQEQPDLAIRNYKEALKNYPDYVIALNNLGNAYEKKKQPAAALEAYQETLNYDPNNSIAKKRVESLQKRLGTSS
ncbi:tetratricopeptide repeat protein [Spirulina sp. CS-785/01]|uniref:tetratricopeptide repeat protein n=1 Tax=Spirulina sp. CS-785/01 TaxID=3021716 RepID=UPI00232A964E|nr:tetratricopeptide repeat protein [Spirulina sp. CS-785/01]MDB9315240.1 tetratricopeptide repeat protein [Spirulina sp. CS-785/01]